jgi:hypothetical protein
MKKTITLLIILLFAWSSNAQSGLGRITFSAIGTNNSNISVTMGEAIAGSYLSSDGKTILTIGAQSGNNKISNPQDSLSLNNYTLNVENSASNPTVQLTSNRTWVISNPASWLTVSPLSGSQNTTLNISILANSSSTPRTAIITITAGTNVKTLTINQSPTVGVSEITIGNEMKIYPNPANSEINVWVNKNVAKNYEIKITDINGKVILETSSQSEDLLIPVSNLSAGNYLINVSNKQNQFNKTIKIFKTNN